MKVNQIVEEEKNFTERERLLEKEQELLERQNKIKLLSLRIEEKEQKLRMYKDLINKSESYPIKDGINMLSAALIFTISLATFLATVIPVAKDIKCPFWEIKNLSILAIIFYPIGLATFLLHWINFTCNVKSYSFKCNTWIRVWNSPFLIFWILDVILTLLWLFRVPTVKLDTNYILFIIAQFIFFIRNLFAIATVSQINMIQIHEIIHEKVIKPRCTGPTSFGFIGGAFVWDIGTQIMVIISLFKENIFSLALMSAILNLLVNIAWKFGMSRVCFSKACCLKIDSFTSAEHVSEVDTSNLDFIWMLRLIIVNCK
eukprot:TRINITY_DN10131_c0_g1_i1.p1 TRINITY_DN10131_c0_g1~~TRINITY_DN10131_c0_g1_i1.p1  ORF type:complete len:334 (+),score=59.14 TRINITY_DN10131_c0_g1_i1:60-1004(+)